MYGFPSLWLSGPFDTDGEVGNRPAACLNSPPDAAHSWRPYYATSTSPSVSEGRENQSRTTIDIWFDRGEEFGQVEGLGQDAIGPDLAGAFRRLARRGHDDDRRVRTRALAIDPREFPPVHDRHAHVEEDEGG